MFRSSFTMSEQEHRQRTPCKRRICFGHQKINFSTVFAGQAVGIKEVHDDIWLVSFIDYDVGYFDLETRVLEPLENPFGPRLSPM
jgi:putative transposase